MNDTPTRDDDFSALTAAQIADCLDDWQESSAWPAAAQALDAPAAKSPVALEGQRPFGCAIGAPPDLSAGPGCSVGTATARNSLRRIPQCER